MDGKELQKLIRKAAGNRTKLVDELLAELEKTVTAAQQKLLNRFLNDFVNKLDVAEDGRIKDTLRNKRLLATVDTIFTQYVKTDGVEIAKTMVDGVKSILDFNGKYYQGFNTKAVLIPINATVKEFMQSWLGLKGNGALEGNGYLQKTVSDTKVLNELKNLALRAVVGQQGHDAMRAEVKQFIEGNQQTAGLLQKYYRNFVYDTYSQVDRAAAQVYADKLKLNYAIYEGGLIKTSRKFCIERNGKVFTREEIAAFDPKEAKQPNYNPFTDLGGFGCRHHLNWIPYTVAVIMRPDLAIAA